MTTAGDLVRRAQTPQDQIAIAQMLGFTKEWIPFLEQAAHGLDSIRNAAQDAGVVISDETIDKAAEFDERWRKSSVEWSLHMRAARQDITGFATDLTHAMQASNSFWSSFQPAGVNALNKIADKLMSMAIDNLWSKAFGGTTGGGLLGLFGTGGGGSAPTCSSGLGAGTGGLSFPMFADGTDNAPGGWSIVGEKGPELVNLPKGLQVLPNGVMPGASVSAPVNVTIDARGADAAGLARVQQQIADLRVSLPNVIVSTVQKAKTTRR
ncbi:hypothetical protein [Bradyrhizobium sp. 164]|uniref:hypothetical protein n=1 Tax=Bradyrhizobium sp. 164 TaxID=2782637 RepID=UPI001FF92835|nr:hypothetical protein [Bradyrhizobium sp. 164]MCK1599405.1 hypothetical protein [Bradyrhizobium sp. 164]